MIILHQLRIGRPIYTVWLLEELGLEYELKTYHRNPDTMRAEDDLKQAHPLGKSPVIEDGGIKMAESGAITTYLIGTYDEPGNLSPLPTDRAAWAEYLQWLHYPEGSAFLPLLMTMLIQRSQPEPGLITMFADGEVALHLDYVGDFLGAKDCILGDKLSGADFGMTYIIALAERLGLIEGHANFAPYLERMRNRPAFQRAVERAVE